VCNLLWGVRDLIADSERLMKQVGQAAGSRRSFGIVRAVGQVQGG
jgi:hypothetical protein